MKIYMKSLLINILAAFILLFATIFSAFSQNVSELDAVLAKAYETDQSARLELVDLLKRANTDGYTESLTDSLVMISMKIDSIDIANYSLVSSILDNGLPEGLSEDSYKTLWIVIDHAEPEQQMKYFPILKKAARKGLISKNNIATLYDRICMYSLKPQKYGTQSFSFTSDGKQVVYIWPVKNPRGLDRRREKINTVTIEEYVDFLKESAGTEVIYNPDLTVKDMVEMGVSF